ncbi:MAG: hypothetical protein IKE69_11665 [Thermoguttaceae bacterium]|nr:hypothetical protein [Thermoguttaceae bacterium]
MIVFILRKEHPDFNKWFKGTIKSVWESETFFYKRTANGDRIVLQGARAMKFLKLATGSKWFTEKPSTEYPNWKCFPLDVESFGSVTDTDRNCKNYWDSIRCEKREGN